MLQPRRTSLSLLLSLLCLSLPSIRADDSQTFDCRFTVNNLEFNLTSLTGEHIINRTRSTPPSTVVESLRFNLCGDLKKLEGLSDQDQVRLPTLHQLPTVCNKTLV